MSLKLKIVLEKAVQVIAIVIAAVLLQILWLNNNGKDFNNFWFKNGH